MVDTKQKPKCLIWFGFPLLLGAVSVCGPYLLHRTVETAIRRKAAELLAHRSGGRVHINAIWPLGIVAGGIKIEGLHIAWEKKKTRGRLHIEDAVIRFNPKTRTVTRIELRTATLQGGGPTAELWALARRMRRRRKRQNKGHASPLQNARRRIPEIVVEALTVDLSLHDGPLRRVVFGPSDLVLKPCANTGKTCLKAHTPAVLMALSQGASISGHAISARLQISDPADRRNKGGLWWMGARLTAGIQKLEKISLERLTAADLSVHLPRSLGRLRFGGDPRAGTHLALSIHARRLSRHLVEIQTLIAPPAQAHARLAFKAISDSKRGVLRLAGRLKRFPAEIFTPGAGPIKPRKLRLSGRFNGWLGPQGNGRFDTDLQAKGDITIHHRAFARRPVCFSALRVALASRIAWNDRRLAVRIPRLHGAIRGAAVTLAGRIERTPQNTHIAIQAEVPPTDCQALLDAAPEGLVPTLDRMQLAGKTGGRLQLALDTQNLKDLHLSMQPRTPGCRVVSDPPQADVHDLLKSYSMTVRDHHGRRKTWVLGPRNRHYRRLVSLPPHLLHAFLTTEDRDFFNHRGFDWEQIRRALAYDLEHGGFHKGASSISQQLIKNVFLSHRRNVSRKLQEAVLTWRLEQVVSKKRILELYLNLIEMGPGLYGVRQGALTYFRKNPRHLTPLESLHLAAITPSPKRYYRSFKGGRITMAWLLRLRGLLNHMYRHGKISKPLYATLRQKELILAAF
jgi:hypothetical protein